MDESKIERIEGLAKIVNEKRKIVLWSYTDYECPGGGDGHSYNDATVEVRRQRCLQTHVYSFPERVIARRELKRRYRSETDRELKWMAGSGAGYSDSRMEFHRKMKERPVKAIAEASVPWIGAAIYVSSMMGILYLIARGIKGCLFR